MGLLNIIRRMHLRQKLSIREIARLTGVSRNMDLSRFCSGQVLMLSGSSFEGHGAFPAQC